MWANGPPPRSRAGRKHRNASAIARQLRSPRPPNRVVCDHRTGGLVGYRAAASADFFKVRKVETRGAARASNEDIKSTVLRDVGETGVWRADLEQVSKHLERLPWVRTAVVTRVLPDGIRVRITERQPRAVVRTTSGRFIWVDDDAVYLGEMSPTDPMPPFFLHGWNEDDSTQAQSGNRERVRRFLELQREWDAQAISERVSEVNLLDLRDVRVQLAGDDAQIEIRLGGDDQAARLKKALTVLDAQRQTARGPLISYIDLSQGREQSSDLSPANKPSLTRPNRRDDNEGIVA